MLVLVPHSTPASASAPVLLFMVVLVSIHSGLGVHTRTVVCVSTREQWFWCPSTVVWVSTREQWFWCPHENCGFGVHPQWFGCPHENSGLGVHTRTVVWVSTREQWFGCPHENSGLRVHTRTVVWVSTREQWFACQHENFGCLTRNGFAMNRKHSFRCPQSGFAVNTKTKSWTLDVSLTLVTT